jgi:hypothetical protein
VAVTSHIRIVLMQVCRLDHAHSVALYAMSTHCRWWITASIAIRTWQLVAAATFTSSTATCTSSGAAVIATTTTVGVHVQKQDAKHSYMPLRRVQCVYITGVHIHTTVLTDSTVHYSYYYYHSIAT